MNIVWFTQEIGLDLGGRFAMGMSTVTRLLQVTDVFQLKHIGLKCSFVFCVVTAVHKYDIRLVIN
jgi:hypothetical protein